MTRLIDRRLVFGTPLLIGKHPLVVTIEPWGLRLHEKGRHQSGLLITWAQVWNRAAMIALFLDPDQNGYFAEAKGEKTQCQFMPANMNFLSRYACRRQVEAT